MYARFALFWSCLSAMACSAHGPSTQAVWMPTYLFGSIDGGDLDVRDVCRSGVADELSIGSSWQTLGVSVLTLGVYTPREARVRCAPPR